jgi:hypothetical protein
MGLIELIVTVCALSASSQCVHPHNSPWRLQELPKSELLHLYWSCRGVGWN